MIHVFQRIRRNARDYGWRTALVKCLMAPVSPFWKQNRYRLFRKTISEAMTLLEDGFSEFEIRPVHPDDGDAVRQIERMAEWLKGRLSEKLLAGDLCMAAFDEDRVVGFNIITFGVIDIPLINKTREFHSGQAWSEQITVHEDYRRRGIGTALRRRVFALLALKGTRVLYGGTRVTNIPALRLARRVGFQEFVDVVYIRCLGKNEWRYIRLKRAAEDSAPSEGSG